MSRGVKTTGVPLARRIMERVRAQRLFARGERILVALSGGPDSVALLSLLNELAPTWALDLHAVHINHGLRGEEAEEDARFAAVFSAQLGIPFRCERVDLMKGRFPQGRSLQERAREARYDVLARVGRDLAADRIALGHTADDQAETLLMWMLRGAGMTGLAGIPPAREGRIIRPLLEITRDEIVDYLETHALPYRTDSSNVSRRYLRNRVRHELMPALKRFTPSIVGVLGRQAEIFREDDRCLQQLVCEQLVRLTQEEQRGRERAIDRTGLLALPLALQRRLVRTLIRQMSGVPKGPPFTAIASVLERIVQGRSGSATTVQGITIAREYGKIRFHAPQDRPDIGSESVTDRPVRLSSATAWPLTGQAIRVCLDDARPTAGVVPANGPRDRRRCAVFDADRMTTGRLTVRSWRPGDWFQPLGMNGRRKKLQDFFADIKLPREQRRRVPLLVAPEGIVWIAGLRTDHRFRPTSATTRYLIVELLDDTSEEGAR